MLRRTRQAFIAAASLAAGCGLLAPLDGLTGGDGGAGGTDATNEDAADAPEPEDGPSEAVTPETDARPDAQADAAAGTDGDATAAPPYAAVVLGDSPLAYWRLGDALGSAVCHDATGNGNDANLIAGATLGVPGALRGDPDTAARFDGASGVLDVGDKFGFTGSAPLTIEMWAYPEVIDTAYRHLETKMLYDDAGDPYDGIYFFVHQGTTLGFERWGNGSIDLGLAAPGVTTGQWWYIVGTFDGSYENLYVDGALVQNGPTAVAVAQNGMHLLLGQQFQGSLDEVAIYGAALSQSRIQAHWHAAGM